MHIFTPPVAESLGWCYIKLSNRQHFLDKTVVFFIFWTKNWSLFCIFPFVALSSIEQHQKSTTQLVKAETNKNFPNSTKSLASPSSSSFLGGKAAVKMDIISGVTPTCNNKSAQIVKHIYMSNLGQ